MSKISYLFVLMVLLLQTARAGELKDDAEQVIRKVTGEHDPLRFSKYELDSSLRDKIEKKARQKFFESYIYLWEISRGDTLTHLALLDNVYGKSLPITFICIFRADGTLLKVTVLRYREPYGGAVTGQTWLDQFIGTTSQDELKIGQEIDAITGATISSRSLTAGIKKLSLLAAHLLHNGGSSNAETDIISTGKE